MPFPNEWWIAVEVVAAIGPDGGNYAEALKAWRKTQIGRKAAIRAKDFDNAARGTAAALAGKPESAVQVLQRARWYIANGIPPTFARPVGWPWTREELEVIRIARSKDLEPVFLSLDTTGIDQVPGPKTKPNPWDRWMNLT